MSHPIFRFSTQALPPKSRFEAWRDEVNALFEIDIGTHARATFNYSLATAYVGDLLMGCGTWEGAQAPVQYAVKRGQRMLRRDGLDHYYICLGLSHAICGSAGRQPLSTQASQIYVLDLARELDSEIVAGDTIILTIPRDVLSARLGHKDLHGLVVQGALGGLLADHMRALRHRLPDLTPEELPHVYQATLAMVAAALAPGAATLDDAAPHIDHRLLARARQLIEQQLSRADLDPASVARQLGVSRAALYRLFAADSGVAAYIQRRRLIKARELLRNGHVDRPRISSLAYACGFKSEAHFSRAFKAAFGYTPSEAREQTAAQPASATKHQDMHTGFSLKALLERMNSD